MSDYIIKTKLKNNNSYDNISYKCRNINNKKMSDVYNSTTNTMLRANYNYVIRSQEEFETFVNNINLSYGSVLFIGDGGNLEFTLSSGDLIFSTKMFEVEGINNAKIKLNIDNYLSRTPSSSDEFKLKGITLISGSFRNIKYLEDCHTWNGGGFQCCSNLMNCSIKGYDSTTVISGYYRPNCFFECNNLTNCVADYSGVYSNLIISRQIYGYERCGNLINCSFSFYDTSTNNVNIQNSYVYGYSGCGSVSNCGSTIRCSESNQSDLSQIISFYECNYLNACRSFYSICDSTNNSEGYGYVICNHGSACSAQNYTTNASYHCTKWDTNSCD